MNVKLVSSVVSCLCSVVFLVPCITSALTEAASYQETDGEIVDPLRETEYNIRWISGERDRDWW